MRPALEVADIVRTHGDEFRQAHAGSLSPRQKRVLRSLGLRHPHQSVVRPDNPAVRGMVNAIRHLVRIVEEGGHGA